MDKVILTQDILRASEMEADYLQKYDQSQIIRIEAIKSAYEVGLALISIRNKLNDAGASPNNPVETDIGTFTSFENFLISGPSKESRYKLGEGNIRNIGKTTAYKYIALAENWHIVLKLGLQDTTNELTRTKAIRLNRTLHVINWYNNALEAGRPEEELTLSQYWIENGGIQNKGPSKKELQQELADTKYILGQTQIQLNAALSRIKELETQLQTERSLTTV